MIDGEFYDVLVLGTGWISFRPMMFFGFLILDVDVGDIMDCFLSFFVYLVAIMRTASDSHTGLEISTTFSTKYVAFFCIYLCKW